MIKAVNRFHPFLDPVLSLFWGVWTALTMQRSHQGALKLAIVSALLVIVSQFSEFWGAGQSSSLFSGLKEHWMGRVGNWIAFSGVQSLAQFILFFCIPFFWRTAPWFALICITSLAVSTLWDPFFDKLYNFSIYRGFLKSYCLVCASFFSFPIFFPDFLKYLYLFVFVIIFISMFPFCYFIKVTKCLFKNKFLYFLKDFVKSIFIISIILVLSMIENRIFKIPISSIWLKEPSLVFKNNQICCLSPLVAPGHLKSKIIHKWLYKKNEIDQISLSDIEGLSDRYSFHTYSCKSKFPFDIKIKEEFGNLTCEVILPFDKGEFIKSYLIGSVKIDH